MPQVSPIEYYNDGFGNGGITSLIYDALVGGIGLDVQLLEVPETGELVVYMFVVESDYRPGFSVFIHSIHGGAGVQFTAFSPIRALKTGDGEPLFGPIEFSKAFGYHNESSDRFDHYWIAESFSERCEAHLLRMATFELSDGWDPYELIHWVYLETYGHEIYPIFEHFFGIQNWERDGERRLIDFDGDSRCWCLAYGMPYGYPMYHIHRGHPDELRDGYLPIGSGARARPVQGKEGKYYRRVPVDGVPRLPIVRTDP